MSTARARLRRGVAAAPRTTRRSRARVASNAATSAHTVVQREREHTPTANVSQPMRISEARGTPAAVGRADEEVASPTARARTRRRPRAARRARFSATIWRTIRARLAPSASRVANSCWRSSAPPTSRPAAFPQATSSSAITAAASAYSDGRTSRVSCSSRSGDRRAGARVRVWILGGERAWRWRRARRVPGRP